MYYALFRWFPKTAFTRLMGALADARAPGFILRPVIRLYARAFQIELAQAKLPVAAFPTFNAFFTRELVAGARVVDQDPRAVVCPVDGKVSAVGDITGGRLFQAKGVDYSLEALLGGDARWREYEGGRMLTVYLSPRDYHRIHTPAACRVTRVAYVPGQLWTVSPVGMRQVPGLLARNERVISFLETEFGEVALVKVGATVVGRVRVVYHPLVSNRPGLAPFNQVVNPPHPLERGAEIGRFELGSTIVLLFKPGQVKPLDLQLGQVVRMGQKIAERV